MPIAISPDNPVAWAQFYRKTTARGQLLVLAGYSAVLLACVFVTSQLARRDPFSAYVGWCGGLLALQSTLMLLIGSVRISGMVRGDLTSGMAESIRMMPVPPSHVVIGFLIANAATMAGAFFTNLLVGALTTFLAGLPIDRWIWANLILAAFSIFVWTLAVFLAFQVRGAGAILLLCGMGVTLGNAGVLYAIPGVLLLLSPLIGESVFNLRGDAFTLPLPLLLSLAAQLLIGAIFVAAAARKQRRPDAPALGPLLGLLLLAAAVGISLLAIERWEEFQPRFMGRVFGRPEPMVPFMGSVLVCSLIALAPLSSLARMHVLWTRVRLDDPSAPRTVPPLPISGLVAAMLLASFVLVAPGSPTALRVSYTLLAFCGFAVSIIFIAAFAHRVTNSARRILPIWIFLYSALPLIIDAVRHSSIDPDDPARGQVLATASTFSPVGLLIQTWSRDAHRISPVAANFHFVAPLLALAMYTRASRVNRPAPIS